MGIEVGTVAVLLGGAVLGAGAAYYSSTQAAGDYSIPEPPESPYPTETERDTALEEKRKKIQARNAARENFIATGGQGLLAPPETTKKTLLGR